MKKTTRSSHIQERPAPRPAAPPRPRDDGEPPTRFPARLTDAWARFWFRPADPVGLHVLRLLGGALILYWLLGYAGHLDAFFGLQGWFDRQALSETAHMPGGSPGPINWSLFYLAGDSPAVLTALYFGFLVSVLLFTLGVATRLTGVLTWLAVASFHANPVLDFDGDALISVLAFYLMVGHLLMGWSRPYRLPGDRILGPLLSWPLGERGAERPASAGANATLRLVQIHFAIIVVTSGLHKLQFAEWWSGVALWYPLHPVWETTVASARKAALGTDLYLVLLSLATYAVLAWQLAFPAFAWRAGARWLLLGGAAAGWVWCGFVMGLPLIGPAFAILCLAYVTPREWSWLGAKLRQIPGPGKVLGKLFAPEPAEKLVQR